MGALTPLHSMDLLKKWISAEFLPMEGYVQGALQKELHVAHFVECFKRTTLGRSY